jgi:hypothetical protein
MGVSPPNPLRFAARAIKRYAFFAGGYHHVGAKSPPPNGSPSFAIAPARLFGYARTLQAIQFFAVLERYPHRPLPPGEGGAPRSGEGEGMFGAASTMPSPCSRRARRPLPVGEVNYYSSVKFFLRACGTARRGIGVMVSVLFSFLSVAFCKCQMRRRWVDNVECSTVSSLGVSKMHTHTFFGVSNGQKSTIGDFGGGSAGIMPEGWIRPEGWASTNATRHGI